MKDTERDQLLRMAGSIAGGLASNPHFVAMFTADAKEAIESFVAEQAVGITLRIFSDPRLVVGPEEPEE